MSKGVWNNTKEKLNSIHKAWTDMNSPLISTQQIAKYVKMDWHTAEKYLIKLEKMDLVGRIEIRTKNKKITYWEKKKKLREKSTDSV